VIWDFFKTLIKFLVDHSCVPFILLFVLGQDVNFCRINALAFFKYLLRTVSQDTCVVNTMLSWAHLKNLYRNIHSTGNKQEELEGVWLPKVV